MATGKMSTKKLTTLSLFTTLSLAVYAAESLIPPLLPIPGIKPGLSNIITLVLLHRFSAKDAALVLTARVLLCTLLFGQAMSLLYSVAGGVCSLLAMYGICRILRRQYLFLAGAVGGLIHNLAQLSVAYLLTATVGVLSYAPFLCLSGILTGLFTGLCALFGCRHLPSQLSGQ